MPSQHRKQIVPPSHVGSTAYRKIEFGSWFLKQTRKSCSHFHYWNALPWIWCKNTFKSKQKVIETTMPWKPNSKLKTEEYKLHQSQWIFVTFIPVIYISLENVLPPSDNLQGVAAQMTNKKSRQELLVLNDRVVTDLQQGIRVEASPGMSALNFFVFLQLRFQDIT